MGNSEPVYYKESRSHSTPASLASVNAVLSRYNQLDIQIGPGSKQEELIYLRHSILGLLLNEPDSISEIKSLQQSLRQEISGPVYGPEDKQEILRICTYDWKNKLLPKLLKLCSESLKFKLKNILPTGTLIDLGFALEAHSRKPESWQNFLLYKIAPILLVSDVSSESKAKALKIIYTEFRILKKLFDLN